MHLAIKVRTVWFMTDATGRPVHGWEPVERSVRGPVLLGHVIRGAQELGFTVRIRNPGHAELHREGTQFTLRGDRFPLDLTLSESEDGVFLQVRYAGFVLADTGDLAAVGDQVAAAVRAAGG